ncbi:ATP-binding/permease protein CydD [uncultured Roseburia sp.]|uniref:ABC transporter ATP-binding protein/permease n=1 Tax=Brotonthovivens ammoniilytica TaxID=2981725 RepID=A0ABT2TMV4_9FIRM|nr:ABC transporter ATP-binding protein/permease [Brotonthovivens ammoniilytica]MCU6763540.1 ABC transporter ATP-binding protein/permease [Brotonthovivens ammoniilytica]SCJ24445.1 ATP-binding/permease protein CydD [uncultured Roseburia sp.]
MMMDKRLIHMLKADKKYIAGNILLQWISLLANITFIFSVAAFLQMLYEGEFRTEVWLRLIITAVEAVAVRFFCARGSAKMSYLSSKNVRKTLRQNIYRKLLKLGMSYQEKVSSAETVQMAVEGVDQLETYFGAYLPQFFYSLLAPVTLFVTLAFVNVRSAVILLICVPLIPAAIAGVQTFAKKLLSKYWGQYTSLGDHFLENLQGLTTLKIYQADEARNQEMNQEAEKFRKITMKVLTMQLNSITIMDLVAYGGAALGILISVRQFQAGNVNLAGALAIILLAAEFFIPMRQLGSFFHIAMNGMAASDRIFKLLEIKEAEQKEVCDFPKKGCCISARHLYFTYDGEREILKDISFDIPEGSFTAVVGESGSGKSTIASILMGRNHVQQGTLKAGDCNYDRIREEELMKQITYVGHNSYLFRGTVRENLLMGNHQASQEEMWEVLDRMRLSGFLRAEQGLDTMLTENGSNFSGGQRQRLALARALLHNSPVYIFDEASSNIDAESEDDILQQIYSLARTKTVLMITHRLSNVKNADWIYVMQKGKIAEQGCHEQLLGQNGVYADLWETQQDLENYGRSVQQWKKEVV